MSIVEIEVCPLSVPFYQSFHCICKLPLCFLQSQSCLELKNFEAVFAIVGGLERKEVQKADTAWRMVTDHLKGIYAEMKEVVSPEEDYQNYRQELCTVGQVPCVPKLGKMISYII